MMEKKHKDIGAISKPLSAKKSKKKRDGEPKNAGGLEALMIAKGKGKAKVTTT
jgi:hypothetical protein